MDLISYRIASGSDQKTQDHLRIGAFPVLGPTGDADVILPGFKIHRGRVVEHNGYGPSENLTGLIVCHFLNIVLDVVCGLPVNGGHSRGDADHPLHRARRPPQVHHSVRRRSGDYLRRLWLRNPGRVPSDIHIQEVNQGQAWPPG